MITEIPERVKVGPYWYDVEMVNRILHHDGERSGEVDHEEQRISIVGNQAPSGRWAIFWHEVLHAVDEVANTALKEDAVTRLAEILSAVLLDNGFYGVEDETEEERQARYERAREVQHVRERRIE